MSAIPSASAFKVDVSRGQSRGDLSSQWLRRPADERFLSLIEMRDHLRDRAERTAQVVVPTKQIEFFAPEATDAASMSKLFVGVGDQETSPTHWSFGQLCSLADFSAREMRKLPSQLAADNLNYLMRYRREVEDVKLFAFDGELRAATGPKYGWIADAELVDAVVGIAGSGRGEMRWKVPGTLDWRTHLYDPETPVTRENTTLYASDRDCFIFLVDDRNPIEIGKLKDGSPDLVFRGFYVTNSEVGSGSLKLATFYLRGICCNRIMWGVEDFEEMTIRHTSGAPARFIEEARPALESLANSNTARLIEGVQKAQAAKVASEEAEALAFLRDRGGFSAARARKIAALDSETGADREDGDFPATVWDMAQSITAYARTIENNDDRVAVEAVAGKLLDKVA